MKSFYATLNYYRKHIRNFSTLAALLYEPMKKGVEFAWRTDHERAIDMLKMRLATAPILSIFDQYCSTVIDTDASHTGLGAVLSQIVDGKERVVAYASQILNDAKNVIL